MSIRFLFACVAAVPLFLQAADHKAALQALIQGNQRYVSGNSNHPSLAKESLNYTTETQEPIAVIVGCSDSRVPPEIIFDQGIGELFVVRVAGNVVGPIEMDSVEFAVAKLNTPLVIVLGHQNCGAVKAALVGKENVPELDCIYPLIEAAFKGCNLKGKDPLFNAIECNVKKGVETLKNSPTIGPFIAQNKVNIVGAYYEIGTGKVTLIK